MWGENVIQYWSRRHGYPFYLDGSAGWCAAILDQNQFLQVEFIRQVRITKISVRGKDVTSGIEQFFLEHSVDDQKWDNYTEYGTLKVKPRLSSFDEP